MKNKVIKPKATPTLHDHPGHWALMKISEELNKSPSDRAVAILAVAQLEQRLSIALRSRLREEKKIAELLFNDGKVLSHIKNLIPLTFLLGWFGQKTCRDLRAMTDVRNLFAHKTVLPNKRQRNDAITFETPEIKSKCMGLCLPSIFRDYNSNNPRERFIKCAALIHAFLGNEIAKEHPDHYIHVDVSNKLP